jgi:hypothetical protein
MRWLAVLALALLAAPLPAQREHVMRWSPSAVGAMRFLYSHMRTEFAGCLYGFQIPDTTVIDFFVTSKTDPRLATDSGVHQGGCPKIVTEHSHLIGITHSHIRPGSICYPSTRDRRVLETWLQHGVLFGAIMCAGGDSIVMFSTDSYGVFAPPPLDSLYRP